MQQQQKLPLIRSYLALYTTISTAKLASFAEGMAEERLRAHIMALKHKHTGLLKTAKACVRVCVCERERERERESE